MKLQEIKEYKKEIQQQLINFIQKDITPDEIEINEEMEKNKSAKNYYILSTLTTAIQELTEAIRAREGEIDLSNNKIEIKEQIIKKEKELIDYKDKYALPNSIEVPEWYDGEDLDDYVIETLTNQVKVLKKHLETLE